MAPKHFISIDQNSLPLWDPVPKLQAALAAGAAGVHLIEDVDTAFTRRGASPEAPNLDLQPERIYRDGTSDWGAALFYTKFLGRNPLDIRILEPYTGLKTQTLAKRLGMTVDQLYEKWAGSDNWQLIGGSYAGDPAAHRVIADVRWREVQPFIRRLWEIARDDMQRAFPGRAARSRIAEWFERQNRRLQDWTANAGGASLADLHRHWILAEFPKRPGLTIGLTSTAFALDSAAWTGGPGSLFEAFIRDYETMAALYNQAVREVPVGVNPLRPRHGELPFFAVWNRGGRWLRTAMTLHEHRIQAHFGDWDARPPLEQIRAAMQAAGVVAIPGKAILLVLQARMLPRRPALLLPEHGSLYMPAAHRFEAKLQQAGRLPRNFPPVLRVHLHFLERLRETREPIVLPPYLARLWGRTEIPAADFARELPERRAEIHNTLERLRTPQGREAFLDQGFPKLRRRVRELNAERRRLARNPQRRAEAGKLWDQVRVLEQEIARNWVQALVDRLHASRLPYWNSRGAILPWSLALGGRQFYQSVITHANLEVEHAPFEEGRTDSTPL